MSLKIRFRFEGKCTRHPRYDPKRNGRPPDGKCEGCESLYVIHLYTKIATRGSENANLMVVRASTNRQEPNAIAGPDWGSVQAADPLLLGSPALASFPAFL
jgi:hypothetical protein